MRASLTLALSLAAGACPVRFDEQTAYDCGQLLGDKAVACAVDDDCDVAMGSKTWTCRDRVCVKDCPAGYRCATDGFCKPTRTACQDGEFGCGKSCVPVEKVPAFAATCCQGCGPDETCCPFYDPGSGQLVDGNVLCVDLDAHPDYCGACGTRCASNQGCFDGSCGGDCRDDSHCSDPSRPTCCGNRCIDSDSVNQHCGSCDNNCLRQGQVCRAGRCVSGLDPGYCGPDHQDCRAQGRYCAGSDGAHAACAQCNVMSTAAPCGAGYECSSDTTTSLLGRCVLASTDLPDWAACSPSPTANPCQDLSQCVEVAMSGASPSAHCYPRCTTRCPAGSACIAIEASARIGYCMVTCPCPSTRVQAPDFSVCALSRDESLVCPAGASFLCGLAGTQPVGGDCLSAACAPGTVCEARFGGSTGERTSATCRSPCSADGGCNEDAGETCQLPANCGLGYCE